MEIAEKNVVQFHYTLKDEAGNQIESSLDGDPVAFLCGYNNVIPGVEKALLGKTAGDEVSVSVQPEDGYGERREDAVQRVPVKHLQGAKKWRPGMVATVHTDQGVRQVTVIKVGRFMVDVDTNHPFAGKVLQFDIKVVDVRDATAEEIEHGHAHGVGGHHH